MTNSRFKFRVWDKQEKHMHYMPAAELYEELFLRADGVLCNVDEGAGYSDPRETDDRYELSFSTGLYDCEGKEIWEGDIIDFSSYGRYLIEFYEGAFRTECLEKKAFESFMINTELLINGVNGDLRNPHAKVIGNRFESPEFLEGE